MPSARTAASEACGAPLRTSVGKGYVLEGVVRDFPGVEIGSYPDRDEVLVTLEGADAGFVKEATARIRRDLEKLGRA